MGMKYSMPHLWKQDEPDCWQPLQYDPAFGFDEARKPKEMIATKEEMDSVGLPAPLRDNCAHHRIIYRQCIMRSFPLFKKCDGLRDTVFHCLSEELLHDMKEFEREKRLNARERRIAQSAISVE